MDNYDYILLRYPMADKSGFGFAQKHRLITEHHTDEVYEALSQAKSKNASLKSKFISSSRYLLETTHGDRLLNSCCGVVGLTDEIRKIQLSRAQKDIPSRVIANGIDVNKISHTGFKIFDGKKLDIVFVMGVPHPWHGLDRILKSIHDYKGNVSVTLHLVGKVLPTDLGAIRIDKADIRLHGILKGKELDSVMREMNVAVSSLAEYRNHMQEACTLKTREYAARGIPFILAHKDPDLLMVDEDNKFFLSVDNNAADINMEEIISFAQDASRLKGITHYMREYASKNMDVRNKMMDYNDFIENISPCSFKTKAKIPD